MQTSTALHCTFSPRFRSSSFGSFSRFIIYTFGLAAVGVEAESAEDLFVQVDVVGVHGSVEGERDHLGNVVGLQIAGNASTVGGAVAVGKAALSWVAFGSAVGVSVDS